MLLASIFYRHVKIIYQGITGLSLDQGENSERVAQVESA